MHQDRLPQSLAEIDALADAFRRRDAAAAEAMANLHVTNACEVALKQLRLREEQGRRTASR